MAAGMPSASDVPRLADVVIDGNAYIFDRRSDSRAELGYTPTFLPRTNVGAGYGDDQQAFWLTAAQKDWSLGEDQRFFRQGNDASVSRYWSGTAIDVATAGEVTMKRAIASLSAGEAINAACPSTAFLFPGTIAGGTTKLWAVAGAAITDLGVHGLGTTPNTMCAGTRAVYVSSEGAGTVGVRSYDGVYATFSATAATRLCYLNNTLYGFRTTGNYDLISYSTAGAVTSIFAWKDANGTVMAPGTCVKLVAHGSKLMIVFSDGSIWQYDGSSTTRVVDLGKDFTPHDACSTRGILYIGGVFDATNEHRNGILQYDGDTIETTWRSPVTTVTITGAVNLTTYLEGLAFVDLSTGTIRRYNVGNRSDLYARLDLWRGQRAGPQLGWHLPSRVRIPRAPSLAIRPRRPSRQRQPCRGR
jgi:hypothetical protein